MSRINGIAVAAIAAGSISIWSGIKGWSILATTVDVISGKQPNQPVTQHLTSPDAGGNALPGATSSAIANDAMKYQGHAYLYGGAPGNNGNNAWDCSSFVNWVVGHDNGMAIPGYGPGKYNGSVHGPPTGSWGIWPGLKHISRSQLQPGDIIVWVGHMGIAIDSNHMISALDTQDRTKITPIDGFGNGPLICYGRL